MPVVKITEVEGVVFLESPDNICRPVRQPRHTRAGRPHRLLCPVAFAICYRPCDDVDNSLNWLKNILIEYRIACVSAGRSRFIANSREVRSSGNASITLIHYATITSYSVSRMTCRFLNFLFSTYDVKCLGHQAYISLK